VHFSSPRRVDDIARVPVVHAARDVLYKRAMPANATALRDIQ